MKVVLEGKPDEIVELIRKLDKEKIYYPITIPSTTPTIKWRTEPWCDTVTYRTTCTGTTTSVTSE